MTLNFILTSSYHGATLLALLLNNHSEILCLGDGIPNREYDQFCACNHHVSECSFWQSISEKLATDRFVSSEQLLPFIPRISSDNRRNLLINKGLIVAGSLLGRWVWAVAPHARDEFTEVWLNYYRTVREMTGSRLFIDGNKNIIKMMALKSALGSDVRLRVIHLVRNPNGFHLSNKKYHPEVTIEQSINGWRRFHRQVEMVSKLPGIDTITLRYETLANEPAAAMARLFEFFEVDNQPVIAPPLNPAKHHLMGNQMMFRFDGVIKQDRDWRERLSQSEQQQIIKLAGGLYQKYDYQ